MNAKKILACLLLLSEAAFCSPEGLIDGPASIRQPHPNLTEIHISEERAILNWKSFSIDHGEAVKFLQNSAGSAVLNRVLGNVPSSILGRLEANGQVYLVNPSGILIGKDAVIQTANFIATTFDIHDAAFLGNEELYLNGTSKAAVINLGTIQTTSGDVALIAYHVDSKGKIDAPQGTVSLDSGTSFILKPQDHHRVMIRPSSEALQAKEGVSHEGMIRALQTEIKADGSIYELAIRDDGAIEATRFEEQDGKILLVAEKGRVAIKGSMLAESGNVEIDGDQIALFSGSSIDVSGKNKGGDVRIGIKANNVYFEEGAYINSSAYENGNAGKVVLISNEALGSFGTIVARGGEIQGDGGFVELSAPHFGFRGTIDRNAPNGKSGLLYIDPCDINITNAGLTDGTFPGGIYSPTMATNNINQADITVALGGGPVTIDTVAGAGGPFGGRLTVVNDYLYNSGNNLTLIADEDLNIQARLENSGTGSINLQGVTSTNIGNFAALCSVVTTSGNITVGSFRVPAAPVGNFTLIGGGGAGFSSEVTTGSGNISITGTQIQLKGQTAAATHARIARTAATAGTITVTATTGDVILDGGSANDAFAQIGGGAATLNTDITVTSLLGTVQLNGTSNQGCYTQIGHGSPAPVSGSLIGNINVTSNQQIGISGGTGADAYAQIGHRGGDIATVVNINGNVQVSTTSSLTMQAGGGDRSYALIGHGTDTYGVGDTWQGDIGVTVGNVFNINGGSGNPSNAVIGFLALSSAAASIGPITVSSNLVSVTAQGAGASSINSGTGTQAQTFIGAFVVQGLGNQISVASLQVNTAGNLNINASTASAQALSGIAMHCAAGSQSHANLSLDIAGDLTLNGGTTGLTAQILNVDPSSGGPFTFSSVINARSLTLNANGSGALLGSGGALTMNIAQSINCTSSATSTAIIASQGGMNIHAGANIILKSNGAACNILELGSASDLIQAGGNIALLSGAAISHTGSSGNLDVVAGQSMFIDNHSNINLSPKLGNLSLVVDNLFPTQPQIGPGMFILQPNGTITALSGRVRIFTAMQNQNTIQGTINTASFTPGPLFANVSPERWEVYYFNPFFYAGAKFTIFYKDTVFTSIVTPQVVQQSVTLTSEQLRDIHPYDEYLGWPLHYTMQFKDGYSYIVPNSLTYYLRKKQRDESQPKDNPVITYDDKDRL